MTLTPSPARTSHDHDAGHDHGHRHAHGHAHGHDHHHGHAHPVEPGRHPSAPPEFRLDPPAWSLLRASLAARLAIAATLVAAIWAAVLATLWSAA